MKAPGSVVGFAPLVEAGGAQFKQPLLQSTRHLLVGLIVGVAQTCTVVPPSPSSSPSVSTVTLPEKRAASSAQGGGKEALPRMVNLRRAMRSFGWVLRTRKRQNERALSGGSPSPVDDSTNTARSNSGSANCVDDASAFSCEESHLFDLLRLNCRPISMSRFCVDDVRSLS